jgi:hypothetical protein
MKDHNFFYTIFSIVLIFFIGGPSKAATLHLDLDLDTPGIQSTRTLNPGSVYSFAVIFSGDGTTQFDTFALDVVHTSPQVTLHSPLAGSIVESAPLMALDIYGANAVNSAEALTQGSMPIPLGFEGGLGGVGISSVGGMSFPLLGQDETVELFSGSLTALSGGTSILALSGFPFGADAELSLNGEKIPVTLQGATVAVVPLPPAIWLFITGLLTLLGTGRLKGVIIDTTKRSIRRWALLCLTLIPPLGNAAVDSDADLNCDAMVTSQDISLLASCFGQDPMSNSACAKADVDEDNDIDVDDYSFVSARLGQAYPEMLFSTLQVLLHSEGYSPIGIEAKGDINGDSALDMIIISGPWTRSYTIYFGSNDGNFQPGPSLSVPFNTDFRSLGGDIELDDVDGDGIIDFVMTNEESAVYTVYLGNGDGTYQDDPVYRGSFSRESFMLVDVDGDGTQDVVSGDYVQLSNGDGTFQARRYMAALSSVSSDTYGDLNGDGVLDIVGLSDDGDILVFISDDDGTFQEQQRLATSDFSDFPSMINLVDFNGDGELDVVGLANGIIVFFGNGDGSFREPQRFVATDTTHSSLSSFRDINNDGALDLLDFGSTRNSSGDTEFSVSILLGNGDGSFQEQQHIVDFNYPMTIRSYSMEDLNGDNILDFVFSGHVDDPFNSYIWTILSRKAMNNKCTP